nr:MAG TPA: hypothetical protein [Caudoviricetes sp.]
MIREAELLSLGFVCNDYPAELIYWLSTHKSIRFSDGDFYLVMYTTYIPLNIESVNDLLIAIDLLK